MAGQKQDDEHEHRGDEQEGEVTRKGQGYPSLRHDMMKMILYLVV